MDILDALLAFLGAAVGSGLVFWTTRSQTRVERGARRREEWGRRFSDALAAVTSTDRTSRAAGRAMLRELLTSQLASDDDRRLAESVLDAVARGTANARLLLVPPVDVDDVTVVRDTGEADDQEEDR